ncbi:MAG: hypothetical protein M0O94_05980 [Bacteroidales bacterium]|nr:hypothetical protein [Bacteroidales bacterium]
MQSTRYFSLSLFFLLAILLTAGLSCTKTNLLDTDPEHALSFSADTLLFDTVFTTIGSTTRKLMIYNPHTNALKINHILLAGGTHSPYRINVDGDPATEINDITLAGGDSLFVFVRVTLDPSNQNNPLIVTDSILFYTNGNEQKVKLVSWGQDAHYIVADTYVEGLPPYVIVAAENEHIRWTNDKPYVIYGYAVVDSAGSLEVEAGVKVHFHSKGGLWVFTGGSIHVNGTQENPVTFQGDRLEEEYDHLPGQWDRILINEGPADNWFHHAIIKNAYIGIQAEPLNEFTGNTLIINNTQILNMTGMALYTKAYRVRAANSVFGNAGAYAAALTLGGDYDFRHCTFATFYGYNSRSTPALFLNNYSVDPDNNLYPVDLINAYFGNCIIFGNKDEEIGLDYVEEADFVYSFTHCLLKTKRTIDQEPEFVGCLANENPYFADSTLNFFPDSLISPAVNLGALSVLQSEIFDLSKDIRGASRIDDEAPDAGAYEFNEAR